MDKNVISLLSSSSSSEDGENLNSWDKEEEDQDMMPLSHSWPSKRRKISPATPKPTPLSTVASGRTKRSTSGRSTLTGQDKAKSCAIKCAKEIQRNLDQRPSFIKSLHPTHVSKEFKLGLPLPFCNSHLPKQTTMIELIDNNQKPYLVKYLQGKNALSVGWKEFSIEHNLVEGDALVFQLVMPVKFQVYIVKAHMAERNINVGEEQIGSCDRTKPREKTVEMLLKTPSLAACKSERGYSRCVSEEVGSEVLEGMRFMGTSFEFKDVKSLESFTIVVKGSIIDSELSEQARRKYYELCYSQKAFLHDNLLEKINHKLAAGLISQTIKIAEDITASKLTTSLEQFAEWDKHLGAFEELGMNVGFLRARIKKLVGIIRESEEELDAKKYEAAIAGRYDVKENIKTLKAKLVELEAISRRYDIEIDTLEVEHEELEFNFEAEVDSPW